jgi:hypothetical protein
MQLGFVMNIDAAPDDNGRLRLYARRGEGDVRGNGMACFAASSISPAPCLRATHPEDNRKNENCKNSSTCHCQTPDSGSPSGRVPHLLKTPRMPKLLRSWMGPAGRARLHFNASKLCSKSTRLIADSSEHLVDGALLPPPPLLSRIVHRLCESTVSRRRKGRPPPCRRGRSIRADFSQDIADDMLQHNKTPSSPRSRS